MSLAEEEDFFESMSSQVDAILAVDEQRDEAMKQFEQALGVRLLSAAKQEK
ncbi:MAG: hypothetical protein KA436_02900 [Oligoflexales bacterium]|nr:hypothetical protein [Oligoflexales bacterium]